MLDGEEYAFKDLLDELDVTKGNLSVQTSKLEDAGFIKIKKQIKNKKSHTTFKITKKGIKIFREYLGNLEDLIKEAKNKLS